MYTFVLFQFAVLLLIIFIVELAVGIAASVAKDEFSNAMKLSLKHSMTNYTVSERDQKAWDAVQKKVV